MISWRRPACNVFGRREFWHFGGILLKNRQISREFAGFPARDGTRNYGVNLQSADPSTEEEEREAILA